MIRPLALGQMSRQHSRGCDEKFYQSRPKEDWSCWNSSTYHTLDPPPSLTVSVMQKFSQLHKCSASGIDDTVVWKVQKSATALEKFSKLCHSLLALCKYYCKPTVKLQKRETEPSLRNGRADVLPSSYGSTQALPPHRKPHGGNGVHWGQRSSSSNASGAVEVEAAAVVHSFVTTTG